MSEARARGGDGRELPHTAASLYARALDGAREHAEATRLPRCSLGVVTRMLGPEHRQALISASNLARSLPCLGERAEAAVLRDDDRHSD